TANVDAITSRQYCPSVGALLCRWCVDMTKAISTLQDMHHHYRYLTAANAAERLLSDCPAELQLPAPLLLLNSSTDPAASPAFGVTCRQGQQVVAANLGSTLLQVDTRQRRMTLDLRMMSQSCPEGLLPGRLFTPSGRGATFRVAPDSLLVVEGPRASAMLWGATLVSRGWSGLVNTHLCAQDPVSQQPLCCDTPDCFVLPGSSMLQLYNFTDNPFPKWNLYVLSLDGTCATAHLCGPNCNMSFASLACFLACRRLAGRRPTTSLVPLPPALSPLPQAVDPAGVPLGSQAAAAQPYEAASGLSLALRRLLRAGSAAGGGLQPGLPNRPHQTNTSQPELHPWPHARAHTQVQALPVSPSRLHHAVHHSRILGPCRLPPPSQGVYDFSACLPPAWTAGSTRVVLTYSLPPSPPPPPIPPMPLPTSPPALPNLDTPGFPRGSLFPGPPDKAEVPLPVVVGGVVGGFGGMMLVVGMGLLAAFKLRASGAVDKAKERARAKAEQKAVEAASLSRQQALEQEALRSWQQEQRERQEQRRHDQQRRQQQGSSQGQRSRDPTPTPPAQALPLGTGPPSPVRLLCRSTSGSLVASTRQDASIPDSHSSGGRAEALARLVMSPRFQTEYLRMALNVHAAMRDLGAAFPSLMQAPAMQAWMAQHGLSAWMVLLNPCDAAERMKPFKHEAVSFDEVPSGHGPQNVPPVWGWRLVVQAGSSSRAAGLEADQVQLLVCQSMNHLESSTQAGLVENDSLHAAPGPYAAALSHPHNQLLDLLPAMQQQASQDTALLLGRLLSQCACEAGLIAQGSKGSEEEVLEAEALCKQLREVLLHIIGTGQPGAVSCSGSLQVPPTAYNLRAAAAAVGATSNLPTPPTLRHHRNSSSSDSSGDSSSHSSRSGRNSCSLEEAVAVPTWEEVQLGASLTCSGSGPLHQAAWGQTRGLVTLLTPPNASSGPKARQWATQSWVKHYESKAAELRRLRPASRFLAQPTGRGALASSSDALHTHPACLTHHHLASPPGTATPVRQPHHAGVIWQPPHAALLWTPAAAITLEAALRQVCQLQEANSRTFLAPCTKSAAARSSGSGTAVAAPALQVPVAQAGTAAATGAPTLPAAAICGAQADGLTDGSLPAYLLRCATIKGRMQLLHQLAQALAALHDQHQPMAHGDLTLSSLLITHDGDLLVTGHGLSHMEEGSLECGMEMDQDVSAYGMLAYKVLAGLASKPELHEDPDLDAPSTGYDADKLTPSRIPAALLAQLPGVTDRLASCISAATSIDPDQRPVFEEGMRRVGMTKHALIKS
ncbi:hypothetical protein QJQ45_018289, partial [Haematococcus lacustris]